MEALAFYIFSALAIVFALLVIIKNEPVASSLSLSVCFLAIAALFITLESFFIGTIQILVYSGAIMVLFLFIIMLFEAKLKIKYNMKLIGMAVAFFIMLMIQIFIIISLNPQGKNKVSKLKENNYIKIEQGVTYENKENSQVSEKRFLNQDIKITGKILFQKYGSAIIGVALILLIATVGVTSFNRT